jgi:lysozyme family protein
MTWEQFFEWLMKWESREVTNDPRDPGGMTAWGISRRYHPNWDGWALVDAGITSGPDFEAQVQDFYRGVYWVLWESAPARVREVLVDTAVNMGSAYAVKCVQTGLCRLAGSPYVSVDGKMGPQTMTALKHASNDGLAFVMCAVRMAEYNSRARRDPNKRVWLSGWINRVADLLEVI